MRAWPTIPAAVPVATTCPLAMITSREHSSASSMLWVVTMAPAPACAAVPIVSHSRARASGSTPEVGSSSSRSSGLCARAWANATRRATPSGRSRTQIRAYGRSASGTRPAPGAEENAAREKARFSATVRSSYRPRPCGTYPIRRRAARDGGCPNSRTEPPETGSSPSSIRIRVVLPAPLAPSSPTTSPGPTVRSTRSTTVSGPKVRLTWAHSASGSGMGGL